MALCDLTLWPRSRCVFMMMLMYASASGHTTSFEDFFATEPDGLGGQRADFAKFGINLQRARTLRKYLRFPGHDRSGNPSNPFHCVSTLIDTLNVHFKELWEPGTYLVIDESIFYWMGRGMPGWIFIKQKPLPGEQYNARIVLQRFRIVLPHVNRLHLD